MSAILSQFGRDGKSAPTNPLSSFNATPPPASYEPKLELVGWHWGQSESESYVEAEGQVQNISGELLRNVEAVVTFYDKSGGFITSDEAIIEYNPILPDQVSPFKTITTWNPAMRKAGIEFKFLMGGTIPHRTRDEAK